MKYLKMLGLAAIAATALMAFVGPSTASAYTLCELGVNREGKCVTGPNGESRHYASGTKFTADSTNSKLTVFGEGAATEYITCSTSKVALESTSTGDDLDGAVTGKITSVEWEGCAVKGGFPSCTVSKSSGYTGSVTGTSGGNGSVNVKGTGIRTKVVCGLIFSCEYEPTASGISLSLTGGNPAVMTASEQPLTLVAGGFGCGTEAKWDSTYNLEGANSALWVGTGDA